MVPFAEGGMHAIRNALNLAKALSQVGLSSTAYTIEAALGLYLIEMLECGLEGLRRSHEAPTRNRPYAWGQFALEMPEDAKLDDGKP
ncbi:hypothetical protein GGR53DRAFT_484116 [Hypoxylon sp. FL1150]|nr:hypothetical protein GGR53DRAFT_484116 [Hypoxylon sp. FL1150]